ncbi:septum site-determining protein MinC [Caloramator sp. E03]|uniref:septum site-determining protein MinC n=1 Tax=Caloramator sp. E03 TaxID=2576307 RepID=UPI001110DD06|nr:septum site-determining protein MinC [Caloramator sp. E03]QCX32489.1 septum site-determining protein MinC [Caloramator sp. E03]
MDNITIKGNKNGIVVYINSGSYDEVIKELKFKIENAKDFFAGSDIFIVDKGKVLKDYEELKAQLKTMFNINILSYNSDKIIEGNERVFSGIYEGRTKFYKSTIRSGQHIDYNGNVVIIGDVNSGAEVIATGNIIVLGVLRGIAHAGCNGNKRAIVAAYKLLPSQLRIADLIARSPDSYEDKPIVPEIAKIKDGSIIIEPYLPNKHVW